MAPRAQGYVNDTRCALKAGTTVATGSPKASIYGLSDLDMAVANVYKLGRAFLMNLGFTEDSAISALTVACDFGVTQARNFFPSHPLHSPPTWPPDPSARHFTPRAAAATPHTLWRLIYKARWR